MVINRPSLRFSPDGSKFYFRALDANGDQAIWSMAVKGGTPRRVILLEETPFAMGDVAGYSLGPDRIFLTVAEDRSDIWVVDLDWPGAERYRR
jgi:Tol biopolymer transport system component